MWLFYQMRKQGRAIQYLATGCLLPNVDKAYVLQPAHEKRLKAVLNASLRAPKESSILTAESTMEVVFEGPLSNAFVENVLAELSQRFNPRMWPTILRLTEQQRLRVFRLALRDP